MSDASLNITPEQALAIHAARSRENLFITGSAGTGKSHLERLIVEDAEENGLVVILAAPTGIAAEAIGGCTLHRLLGLSGPLVETDETGKVSLAHGSVKNLAKADILIIDEISMVSRPLFDILAVTLAASDKEGHPVQLIVSGDFFSSRQSFPRWKREPFLPFIRTPAGRMRLNLNTGILSDFIWSFLRRTSGNVNQDFPASLPGSAPATGLPSRSF